MSATAAAGSMTRRTPRLAPSRLMSDDRLARQVAAGDRQAFATLYGRHHQAIFRYCLTILRHEQDAQDVLQTTMANALTALSRAVPDAPVRPWLFRIAHNEAVSALRRRRPVAELDPDTLVAGGGLEARVEDRRRLALLVADLQDLPERQRGALVMRELSGLSHDEIGAALELPAPKAKQAILDARLGLREFEKGRAMQCADVQCVISERDGRQLRGRPIRAHLRGCAGCRELRDAIQARHRDFALLAPPLAPALAAGLLAKLFGGGGSGGGAAVGVKATGATLMAKAITGAAVIATVGAGAGVTELRSPAREKTTAAPRVVTGAAAADPAAGPGRAEAQADRAAIARTEPAVRALRARRWRPGRGEKAAPAGSPSRGGERTPSTSDQPAEVGGRPQRSRGRGNGAPGRGQVRAKPGRPARSSKPGRPAKPTKPDKPVVPVSPAKPVRPKRTPGGQAAPDPTAAAELPTVSPGAGTKEDPDLREPEA